MCTHHAERKAHHTPTYTDDAGSTDRCDPAHRFTTHRTGEAGTCEEAVGGTTTGKPCDAGNRGTRWAEHARENQRDTHTNPPNQTGTSTDEATYTRHQTGGQPDGEVRRRNVGEIPPPKVYTSHTLRPCDESARADPPHGPRVRRRRHRRWGGQPRHTTHRRLRRRGRCSRASGLDNAGGEKGRRPRDENY